ncbi:TPM domain-containing protein [candidate division KSB1 bacterium]|nr:TPM domain-containing protein [candidate division KSB1 bacterium]
MKRRLVLLLLQGLVTMVLAEIDIPYLTGRVNDTAQILSPEVIQSLSQSLKEHENRTGNQIAVLTIPTLGDENIEDYAVKVFEEWKLGQKGKDNGILIVVAPNDRRLRIEVGYGLEGTLTDATAGRIIRSAMTPRFKSGDYEGGIIDGARALIDVLEGGDVPEPEPEPVSTEALFDTPNIPLMERILIGAFIFGIIGVFTAIGVVTPGVGWFLYFFLIPFWATFPIMVIGTRGAFACLVVYLVVFPILKVLLKKTNWYQKAYKDLRTKGKASIGGFTLRSGGSSSFGRSGFSSSSGFSGGGGSSGGGGASGSW